MTELLLFIFILFTILTYLIFDGDLLAPPFIFCAMYTFSIGCALVNKEAWELDISDVTFLIYVIGAVIMISIGCLCKGVLCPRLPGSRELKLISVDRKITWCFIIFDCVILIFWILNVYRIASQYSAVTSIGRMMEIYRSRTSYSVSGDSMPGWLSQSTKFVIAGAYIYLFVFINNFLTEKKKEWLYLIPVASYMILSLFSSNRLNLLEYVAAAVIFYYLLFCTKNKRNRKSFKFIFRVITIFMLVLIAFYAVRFVVGRSSSSGTGIIAYITHYAGGSLKLFDLFMENPIRNTDIWGKETFISLNGNLRKLGLADIPSYIVHKEFRYVNGVSLGNVYGAYRVYFADFGWPGVIILTIIFSFFYNAFYYGLLHSNYYQKKFSIIIYAYMSGALFLHPIDDEFYRYTVCIGFLIYLAVFYIVYHITIAEKRVRIKIR